MNDLLWTIALGLNNDDQIADVSRCADECGQMTLVRIDGSDGSYVIAGLESDDDGEVDGYTYTLYSSDGEIVSTDGGSDVDMLGSDILSSLNSAPHRNVTFEAGDRVHYRAYPSGEATDGTGTVISFDLIDGAAMYRVRWDSVGNEFPPSEYRAEDLAHGSHAIRDGARGVPAERRVEIWVKTSLEATRIAGSMAGSANGVWSHNRDCTTFVVSRSNHPADCTKAARIATIHVGTQE